MKLQDQLTLSAKRAEALAIAIQRSAQALAAKRERDAADWIAEASRRVQDLVGSLAEIADSKTLADRAREAISDAAEDSQGEPQSTA